MVLPEPAGAHLHDRLQAAFLLQPVVEFRLLLDQFEGDGLVVHGGLRLGLTLHDPPLAVNPFRRLGTGSAAASPVAFWAWQGLPFRMRFPAYATAQWDAVGPGPYRFRAARYPRRAGWARPLTLRSFDADRKGRNGNVREASFLATSKPKGGCGIMTKLTTAAGLRAVARKPLERLCRGMVMKQIIPLINPSRNRLAAALRMMTDKKSRKPAGDSDATSQKRERILGPKKHLCCA